MLKTLKALIIACALTLMIAVVALSAQLIFLSAHGESAGIAASGGGISSMFLTGLTLALALIFVIASIILRRMGLK